LLPKGVNGVRECLRGGWSKKGCCAMPEIDPEFEIDPELEINPEKVCFLIVKARAFDEDLPSLDEDDPEDPTVQEMVGFINSLTISERVDLVALAWLGRGTFDREEWADAVAEARAAHNQHTARYLLGMPQLGDFLEEGLAQLGLSCEEYEMDRL